MALEPFACHPGRAPFGARARTHVPPDLQFSNGNEYSRGRGTSGPGLAPPGSSPGASGMTKREAALRGEGVGASLANAAPSGGDFLGPGMVRAAIVGLGRWGRSLVGSVQGKSDDVRFVLAHTRTRATAEPFCREQNVKLVDSFDAILSDPEIDAVVLDTPHSHQEGQVRAAAAAGKHIFVEKPITLDRASADAAVAAARAAGVVLAVGFTRRFHPAIGEVRQRLGDGRMG